MNDCNGLLKRLGASERKRCASTMAGLLNLEFRPKKGVRHGGGPPFSLMPALPQNQACMRGPGFTPVLIVLNLRFFVSSKLRGISPPVSCEPLALVANPIDGRRRSSKFGDAWPAPLLSRCWRRATSSSRWMGSRLRILG